MHEDPNNYTVKEILTDFVLPALNDLRDAQTTYKENTDTRLSKLEAWKNKGVGAIVFIIAVMIPLAVPVIAQALRYHG